mmetsp:Transcript_18937/g.39914  ORF Transcript_18937/g.39914 Transcript_18937/m.39914 type:complete len:408 (-) Transcript_18937:73-1296(-)
MVFVEPTTTQMRALAYAQKPFAALSFLSSLFALYYLLIRHPDKRQKMYHRLILSSFLCFMPLSFCMFLGTWAMPSGSAPWAVGASGTSITCSIQGFLIITLYMAFPFYYASFSIYAYVAVTNNYKEEKYAWMEKWIHIGAYLPPLTLAIVAAVNDWIQPGLSYCTLDIPGNCEFQVDPNCDYHSSPVFIPLSLIVLAELMVGTCTIVYLLCTFDKIQKGIEDAIGMKQIVEHARKKRLQEVSLQTTLYLFSFWIGYIPRLVDYLLRHTSGKINYDLYVTSTCFFSFQGVVLLVIYLVLQYRPRLGASNYVPLSPECPTNQETVSNIRANAAKPKKKSLKRLASSFSFCIFDGTPAEDSPWRAYFDSISDYSEVVGSSLTETLLEEGEEEGNDQTSYGLSGSFPVNDN